jgi:hypothetical protein
MIQAASLEQRIATRNAVSDQEFRQVSRLNSRQREIYLLKAIATHEEVWTVWDGDELPTFTTSGNDAISCGPHRRFAEAYFGATVTTPKVTPIPITDFLDAVLFGQGANPVDVFMFPIPSVVCQCATRDGFVGMLSPYWFEIAGHHPNFDEADPTSSFPIVLNALLKNSAKAGPTGFLP